jgi:thiol-disulfide isomerase/thioredoxin
MRKKIAVFIFMFGAGLAVLGLGLKYYYKPIQGEFFIIEEGQPIPDFSFQTMDGQSFNLYDFKDIDQVIVHFWASWCAPCVVEFPHLIKHAQMNPTLEILAFSSDRNPEKIDRFLEEHAPSLPENFKIIHDGDRAITNQKFSVFQLPETFILNGADMTYKTHIVGAYDGWGYEINN